MAKTGGQAPYGFSWDGDRLVICEFEAAIRRRAFQLFVEHQRKGAVARALNEEGYRTRRGSEWRDVNVKRLLDCESARGRYASNKTATDESGRRFLLPEAEWHFVDCPVLIEKELWDEARAILKKQSEPDVATGPLPVHPFTGLLFCGCGAKMQHDGKARKFVCRACKNKIPETDLDRTFEAELRDMVLPMLENRDPGRDGEAELEAALAQTRSEMESLETLFREERITLQRFGERHRPLSERADHLQQELGRVRKRVKKASSGDLTGFLEIWPNLGSSDARRVANALVNRVVVRREVVEFTYRISDLPKEDPATQRTASPTHGTTDPPEMRPDEPVYIRLPTPPERCKMSGLSRSALNDLIYPRARNGYSPPVKSFKSTAGGGRVVVWASLREHLERDSNRQ